MRDKESEDPIVGEIMTFTWENTAPASAKTLKNR